MIDHLLGKPSSTWKRTQVFLVISFWLLRLVKGDRNGPRVFWIRRANRLLSRFSPYQIILTCLTALYAIRHLDYILGLGSPEPLARLYSRSYYRATWIATALDAGFVTARQMRPKWIRDIFSVVFSGYYAIYANEADEKLRKFRSVATVEMLRTTWEKTSNPYLRFFTSHLRPSLPMARKIFIPRPASVASQKLPPISAMLFFDGTEAELAKATDLVLDFPGGGFICMGPEHHEERLRRWARKMGRDLYRPDGRKRVVVSVDYGKSPEYPYPWAITEGFHAYLTLTESKGRILGMNSGQLNVLLTGDSAGGNVVATVMLQILEYPTYIPRPVALIFAYGALDFNFTSWMSPSNLRTLRSEQSSLHIPGIEEMARGKDHLSHRSPLAVVNDVTDRRRLKRQMSWTDSLSSKLSNLSGPSSPVNAIRPPSPGPRHVRLRSHTGPSDEIYRMTQESMQALSEDLIQAHDDEDADSPEDYFNANDSDEFFSGDDEDKPLELRIRTPGGRYKGSLLLGDGEEQKREDRQQEEQDEFEATQLKLGEQAAKAHRAVRRAAKGRAAPIGTRLTMTSRSGFFQDRIISPSMMRAMAILYIGPKQNPDFETDYYISPILAPVALLAQFPPVLMICGEKDPFVDDTVIFAGRIREAKRNRKLAAAQKEANKSTRFGESLRMSSSRERGGSKLAVAVAAAKPDPILEEDEDEWVQVKIYEGWGHGFLQMVPLMPEVKGVLCEMADWISGAFDIVAAPVTSPLVSSPPVSANASQIPLAGHHTQHLSARLSESYTQETSPLQRLADIPLLSPDMMGTANTSVAGTGRDAGVGTPDPTTAAIAADDGHTTPRSLAGEGGGIHSPPSAGAQQAAPARGLPGILAAALARSSTPTAAYINAPRPSSAASGTATPPVLGSGGAGGAVGGAAKARLDEAELMKRRRAEAVFGLGDAHSGYPSDDEHESDAGSRTVSHAGSSIDVRLDGSTVTDDDAEREMEELL